MNQLKRFSGIFWIFLAAAVVFLMTTQANYEITQAIQLNKAVLDKKMFWYIIIPIFTPIMFGLGLFGWYALKGEYNRV